MSGIIIFRLLCIQLMRALVKISMLAEEKLYVHKHHKALWLQITLNAKLVESEVAIGIYENVRSLLKL